MKSALLELYCESIDKFEEFTTIIENSTVSLSLIGENLNIQIDSDLDDREIENLLLNLYSMIFLYLGYFPKIITFEIENTVIDISNLSGKYTTSKQFEKKYYQIITINSNSITQDIYIINLLVKLQIIMQLILCKRLLAKIMSMLCLTINC